MLKDTYYFSHDYNALTDPKIKKLIRAHGMRGYGIFWAIVESLYNNANELQKDYSGIAFDLHEDEVIIESVINDFGFFVFDDNGNFGSMSIERRLEKRQGISDKRREAANKRWETYRKKKEHNDDANALELDSKRNAVKESKVKEKKEKATNVAATTATTLISSNGKYGDDVLYNDCLKYQKDNPNKYDKEMYVEFLEYWTATIQTGKDKGKELWRCEKTWSLAGRLRSSYELIWKPKQVANPKGNSQKFIIY